MARIADLVDFEVTLNAESIKQIIHASISSHSRNLHCWLSGWTALKQQSWSVSWPDSCLSCCRRCSLQIKEILSPKSFQVGQEITQPRETEDDLPVLVIGLWNSVLISAICDTRNTLMVSPAKRSRFFSRNFSPSYSTCEESQKCAAN